MTTPPIHAPNAFAMLSAAWLSEAARVCASAATSISRVCSPGTIDAPAAPTKNTSSSAVYGLWEAVTKIPSSTPSAVIEANRPGISALSASLPPIRLPATMPSP
jgi:hypothetical protein